MATKNMKISCSPLFNSTTYNAGGVFFGSSTMFPTFFSSSALFSWCGFLIKN